MTKAFLQISLKPEDRDAHRFLWFSGGQVATYRFKRVTFGMNCSPFLLNATLRHHLPLQEHFIALRRPCENFRVDEMLSGADIMDGVEKLYEKAKAIMNRAGMVLTEWSSNSPLFEDKISDSSTTIRI